MNRRHLALIGGATVLVVLAWFALLWSPKGTELAEARDQRAAAQDQVVQLQSRLTKLKDAKRQGPALQALAARVRAAVPETPDLDGFLLATNAAAAKAQVQFQTVAPARVTVSTTGGPNEILLSLTVRGGYFQILDFMDALVALPRVVVLDSIGLTAEQEGGATRLSVSLSGRTFTTAAPGSTTPTTVPVGTAPSTAAPSTTPTSTPTMVP
ncbi:MAG: Tfp pilus assembly protein PilO [Actinomycetia bacterium]|nr:Tfp pilus assembly protein PilO [Actinomycetes bacterium]